MMGEMGDWGYWLLVVIAIVLGVWFGHTMKEFRLYTSAWNAGYERGRRDGYETATRKLAEKERHIDAKI